MSIQKIRILVLLCRLFLHRCHLPDQIHRHLGNVFNGFVTVFDQFNALQICIFSKLISPVQLTRCVLIFLENHFEIGFEIKWF